MMRTTANAWALLILVLSSGALSSCAKEELGMVPFDVSKRPTPVAEVAELEIRAVGADRFTVCPPPGAWDNRGSAARTVDPAGAAPERLRGIARAVDQDYITRTKDYTPTSRPSRRPVATSGAAIAAASFTTPRRTGASPSCCG